VISNVQREDAGSYKCSAANFVGRITSVANVKVNGKLTVCKDSVLTIMRALLVMVELLHVIEIGMKIENTLKDSANPFYYTGNRYSEERLENNSVAM